MVYRYWEEEEKLKAVRLYENGYNFNQISKEVGRSPQIVRKKLTDMGVHYPTKKINKDYLYKIGDIVNKTLKIEKQIRVKKKNQKGYIVQSLIYLDAPTYEITESDLMRGCGCSYNRGYRIYEGNSLYSIEKIRDNIIDIEQSKTIAPNHTKKILFKCSNKDCIFTKKITPHNLVRQGFSCQLCSTGVSFGELSFNAYQRHFDLSYKSEYQLPKIKRRVDFIKFDTEGNIINFVEIQGVQHTDVNSSWYESSHEQDVDKRKWAKENNVLMIEIDMQVSSWEYFKEQINNCEYLPSINEEDEKSILKLMEKNKKYPISEIIELYTVYHESTVMIGARFNVSHTTIGNILKKNGINIGNGNNQYGPVKKVRCIENGIIYKNLSEVEEKTGIGKTSISSVCSKNGKQKTAGGYHWEYIEE